MKKNKPKYKQIIDAAIEVIAENGYYASQVSKIAQKANVADGTIYLYFDNKEDILVSLFKEYMGQFIEKIQHSINLEQSASQKLFTLIEMHFSQLAENHHLATVTQLELRQSNLELRMQINNVLKPYLKVIDSIIVEGINEGSFRKDINRTIIRQMIFGTLDETVTTWVMKERKYDLVDQATGVHQLIMGGLVNK
ncbi:TetR/AcrR family transcriptional regulator [Virgibacillus sp. W0430]|uniref:TetR/AcrR family transcriptional regulator n=1 Tax=Virgibacillus sp. W0430 TaxID=3391580 RepID=UPI003F47A212